MLVDQKIILDTVRDFCRDHISPEHVRAWDEEERYPQDVLDGLAELGIMQMLVTPDYGGIGADPDLIGQVVETLSYHSLAVGQALFSMFILGADAIARLGTSEQKAHHLPRIAEGKLQVAFALTEPNAGSDGTSITTFARQAGDWFSISGQKVYITGAKQSQVMITAVRTDRSKRDGISLLLVDPHSPTITLRPLKKLGLRAIDLNEIFFDDTEVPAENLLGPLNGGWRSMLEGLSRERYYLACIATGAAQAALDQACEYARQRVQFGQFLSKFQMMQQKLVDLQIKVDASRLLTRRAGGLLSQGINCAAEAAMAKIAASDIYSTVAREAIQVFGGSGFTMETPAQQHYRDCKFLEIGGGANEVLRLLIAKKMGL